MEAPAGLTPEAVSAGRRPPSALRSHAMRQGARPQVPWCRDQGDGPIAAFRVERFPARIRYSSMSLPYHIGNG